MADKQKPGLQSRHATRALLTLNAILLIGLMAQWTPAPASAQRPGFPDSRPNTGMVNPADQRREIITQLKSVSARLDRLNEKLSRPVEVKVVEMPRTGD